VVSEISKRGPFVRVVDSMLVHALVSFATANILALQQAISGTAVGATQVKHPAPSLSLNLPAARELCARASHVSTHHLRVSIQPKGSLVLFQHEFARFSYPF
jgi:hypothetical protein